DLARRAVGRAAADRRAGRRRRAGADGAAGDGAFAAAALAVARAGIAGDHAERRIRAHAAVAEGRTAGGAIGAWIAERRAGGIELLAAAGRTVPAATRGVRRAGLPVGGTLRAGARSALAARAAAA